MIRSRHAMIEILCPLLVVASSSAMALPPTHLGHVAIGEASPLSIASTEPHQELGSQPTAPPEPEAILTLLPGSTRLSSTLSEFARENGWEIAWEIDRDFPIDYAARFEGPFLEIIGSVVASLRTTDAPVRAKVYRANKVVRIIHATR